VLNFSLNGFKLLFICCVLIMLISLLLTARKRDAKPFLEKMEGYSLGGMNGLINWAGEDMYSRCFSGMLNFLGPEMPLFKITLFKGESNEVDINERGEMDKSGWW